MINHSAGEPGLRSRLTAVLALTAAALAGCGGERQGNTNCSPWVATDAISADTIEEVGALTQGDMRAPQDASKSPFRAIIRFADTAGPNGLAFVDPGGTVHEAVLLNEASADGQLTVSLGVGQGPLTVAGITYRPNNEPPEVVPTEVVAQYQEGVDQEATKQYANTPRC